MLSYDSSFITRLFGFAEDKNYIYILMEFVPCSDMLKLLKLVTRIPEYHAKYVIAQLAFVLTELHELNIIVRDIKLEHLLLDNYGYIKLVDFGMSTILSSENVAKTMCGSLGYIAPEQLTNQLQQPCLDCWAVGIIFYWLITGQNPFIGTTELETLSNILNKEVDFDESLFSAQASDFVKQCLQKNPERRIKSWDILKHPLFIDIQLQQLREKKLILPYFNDKLRNELQIQIPDYPLWPQYINKSLQSDDIQLYLHDDYLHSQEIKTSIIYEKSQSDMQQLYSEYIISPRKRNRQQRVIEEDYF